jgi:uncharacterized membrane protein YdbT with pleckstrin-like domain
MAPAELKLLVLSPSIKNWPILMGLGALLFVTGTIGLCLLIFKLPTALVVAAAGIALTAWPALQAANTEYVITNVRISVSSGILSKSAVEFRVADIKDIRISATGLQEPLGIGDIELVGAGGSFVLRGVDEPEKVRDRIKTLI